MTLIYLRNEKSRKDRKFVMENLSEDTGKDANSDTEDIDEKSQIFVFLRDLNMNMTEYFINNIDSVNTSLN